MVNNTIRHMIINEEGHKKLYYFKNYIALQALKYLLS